jgi:hypothetical protein
MKNIVMLLLLGAAATTAFAQSFSQPVREVEKAARGAVTGQCGAAIQQGNGAIGDCVLFDQELSLGALVPAGKILVVEDVSASCEKASADTWDGLRLVMPGNSKPLPIERQRTSPAGRDYWLASMPMRAYVKAGRKVTMHMYTVGQASQIAACSVIFTGHLVNAQ